MKFKLFPVLTFSLLLAANVLAAIESESSGKNSRTKNEFLSPFAIPFFIPQETPDLPIQLLYFNGYALADRVLLKWGTATEINNYGFDIEKTVYPNLSWETIGFVFGHGNSNSPKHYTFEDTTVTENGTYVYRLKQINTDGSYEYTDTVHVHFTVLSAGKEQAVKNSEKISLNQNYPNPFNPITRIEFTVPKSINKKERLVTLIIYDALGNAVEKIFEQKVFEGEFQVYFNGDRLPSGVYYYRLDAGDVQLTKKLLLLK